MKVVQIGNVEAPHSTETHVGQALRAVGVDVDQRQENRVDWRRLAGECADAAFVIWTTTYDYAPASTYDAQRVFLDRCPAPVVGFHLDIWWDLAREHRVRESPFFQSTLIVTADGGHDDRWAEVGVRHRWLPPGVSEFECVPGSPRAEFRSPVAFVGSHQGGYHPEHQHRAQLVAHLRRRWGRRCRFWPAKNQPAVRGDRLRDLYASTVVNVGDSCFAGKIRNYHSDRIPETLGRGGFLLHPHVDGVTDGTLYTDGEHLRCWEAGDWRELDRLIDYYTARPGEARAIGEKGRQHVLAHHTYTHRMRQLLDLLRVEGLL